VYEALSPFGLFLMFFARFASRSVLVWGGRGVGGGIDLSLMFFAYHSVLYKYTYIYSIYIYIYVHVYITYTHTHAHAHAHAHTHTNTHVCVYKGMR
jgi:hypothetical protein